MAEDYTKIVEDYSDTLDKIGQIAHRLILDAELSEKGTINNAEKMRALIPRLELEEFGGLGGFEGCVRRKSRYIVRCISKILNQLDAGGRQAYLRKLVFDRLYAFPSPATAWTADTAVNLHLQSHEDIWDLCCVVIRCCDDYTQQIITEGLAFDISVDDIFSLRDQLNVRNYYNVGPTSWRYSAEAERSIINLSGPLDTDRARKYFGIAVDAGLIKPVEDKLQWVDGRMSRLAYFCQEVYCKDDNGHDNGGPFPEKALNALFGVSRLGKARSQLASNKNGVKPAKSMDIDNIFSTSKKPR